MSQKFQLCAHKRRRSRGTSFSLASTEKPKGVTLRCGKPWPSAGNKLVLGFYKGHKCALDLFGHNLISDTY